MLPFVLERLRAGDGELGSISEIPLSHPVSFLLRGEDDSGSSELGTPVSRETGVTGVRAGATLNDTKRPLSCR